MRVYKRTDDLFEINYLLRSKGEFINDYESFISQKPSPFYIEAIEEGEAILLSRDGIYSLYDKSFYWNKFGRLAVEQIYIDSKKRMEELLLLNPEERYLRLMNESPEFFHQYSLKHISSYLGITPQSLSRIRNRLSKTG